SDVEISDGWRRDASRDDLHAVQSLNQLSLNDGDGVGVRNGLADGHQRWNASVDVVPGILPLRSFTSTDTNVGHGVLTGVVVGIETERETRNSFGSQTLA